MSRPLNFLHFTTFYPPYSFGGDAMQLYRLSHALAESGHHVDVVHCVDAFHLLHPGEPTQKFASHPNVVTHELRSGYGSLSPLLTQQTGRPLLKSKAIAGVLASRPFDVIHFHNISLLGPAVLSVVPRHGEAVKLYTTHEHWLICPMHVLWKYDGAPCRSPDCLRCCLQSKRPPQLWRYTGLLKRMSAHVDQFCSPSRFTANMHAERGFAPPMVHLPNFIDRVDDEWLNPPPRPNEAPYFLFAGRLEMVKGLQTLIPLWKNVSGHDLLVAGAGTFEPELRAMAAANPRIRFLGAQSQQGLGALYYHAVACIIPSVTYETFGLTAIEAFARKTPVIARDLGGLSEVIEDSGGGFLYRTDAELIEALGRIAGSPQLRGELGARGYEAFLRWWCRDAHLKTYFDYIENAARKKFGHVPWQDSVQQALPPA
ncbi:MAG: glycosyltransferase family 4 protein [Acidobacteriota bacterium]|nr:glycosyltransferase family 4 protein [Acidobacteriota bacterium]